MVVGDSEKGLLRSGKLARAAGVSTDTLRYYERKGVLPRPRRAVNGYRMYPPEALERVHLIRRALNFGFTLDELAGIMQVRDHGGAPCDQVRSLAASKLENVEARLRELMGLRNELRKLTQDWDARLARRAPGEPAGLLEALATTSANEKRPSPRPRIHQTKNAKERLFDYEK